MTIVLYVLPFLMLGEFSIIGQLTTADIACALMLPWLLIRSSSKKGMLSEEWKFYVLLALWLIGAIISDEIQNTPYEQYSRGWAKIVVFAMNFTAIRLLIGNDLKKAVIFAYLILIAGAAKFALGIGSAASFGAGIFGDNWKFGYGQLFFGTVALISLPMTARLVTRPFGIAASFGASLLNLAVDARSLFGISILTALLNALTSARKRPVQTSMLVAVALATALTVPIAIFIYDYTASQGVLGVRAQVKYERQSEGVLGIFLGGRNESVASTQAIIDSPIFGHGSWARDEKYIDLLAARLQEAGMDVSGYLRSDDLIPTHSFLLGAWVEAGIFGAIFWAWVLWITARGLIVAIKKPTPFSGFIYFTGLSLGWDILFSPFGLDRRITVASSLYLMILMVQRARHQRVGYRASRLTGRKVTGLLPIGQAR